MKDIMIKKFDVNNFKGVNMNEMDSVYNKTFCFTIQQLECFQEKQKD